MKDFFDMLSAILLVVFIMGVVFIFNGTPDIWDVWHNAAMMGTK